MRIGLALPQYDYSVPGESPLQWATLLEWALRAEEAGFDSVWLADHLFMEVTKYGGPSGRFGGYDPVVGLAALARATARVRLGTLVLCTPLRPPTVVAKMLATLDRLSGGRVVAGLGAGWLEPEFAAAGIPFEPPGQRLIQVEDALAILRGMWAESPFTYEGDAYQARSARCHPPPARPVPLWIGGRGERLIDLVARRADGWNHAGWTNTPDDHRAKLPVLEAACARAGRDPATVTRSVDVTVVGRESPAAFRERLATFETLGVSEVVVGLGPLPFSVPDTALFDTAAAAVPWSHEPGTD